MRPPSKVLERWREAEESLGDASAVESAAQRLPERQARLLRALDALERGERADVEARIDEALELDDHELAWALRLALTELPPTQLRAAAKRSASWRPGFPFLDLLRLSACFARGERTQQRPAVRDLSYQRATVGVLADNAATQGHRSFYRSPWLSDNWPRPQEAAVVLRCLHVRGRHGPSEHREIFPRPELDLDAPRWKGLADARDELAAWAAGTSPWGRDQERAKDRAITNGAAAPERALGPLLVRLRRDLAAGRLEGSRPLARACHELAVRAGPRALERQCAVLLSRLELLLDEERDASLLLGLWEEREERLRPEEQARLAALLLDFVEDVDGPEELEVELRAWCAAHEPVPREAVAQADALVACVGTNRARRRIDEATPGATRRRLLSFLLGLWRDRPSLEPLARLLRAGELEEAAAGVGALLRSRPGRGLRGPLEQLLAALWSAGLPPEGWRLVLESARLPAFPSAVLEGAEEQLASRPQPEARAQLLALLLRAGDDEQVRRVLRAEGRALRRLPRPQALEQAFLISVFAWDHPWSRGRGDRRLHERERPLIGLLSHGTRELCAVLAARPRPERLLGLVRWLRAHDALLEAADWERVRVSWAKGRDLTTGLTGFDLEEEDALAELLHELQGPPVPF